MRRRGYSKNSRKPVRIDNRINAQITAPKVRIVGPEGEQLGIVSIEEALTSFHPADYTACRLLGQLVWVAGSLKYGHGVVSSHPQVRLSAYGEKVEGHNIILALEGYFLGQVQQEDQIGLGQQSQTTAQ